MVIYLARIRTSSPSRDLKSSEHFLFSLNYRLLCSFKWTALKILAFELCLIHIVASVVWLPSGQLFCFKFTSCHPSTFSLRACSLPFCTNAGGDNAVVWCELWVCRSSVLKAFQAFPFRLAVCELPPTVQPKNLISPLSWQKLFLCVLFHCLFEEELEVEGNNWWCFVQHEHFFGFPSQLKIVGRQMITAVNVTCDVNTISGPLNGIIHQRESIMTGKWCISKQHLWC